MKTKDVIFRKHYPEDRLGFRLSDLPKDLLDSDIICMGDSDTELTVLREREATEDEIAEYEESQILKNKVKLYMELTNELSGKSYDSIPNDGLVNKDVIDFRYSLIEFSTTSINNGFSDKISFNEVLSKFNIHFSMRGYDLG